MGYVYYLYPSRKEKKVLKNSYFRPFCHHTIHSWLVTQYLIYIVIPQIFLMFNNEKKKKQKKISHADQMKVK